MSRIKSKEKSCWDSLSELYKQFIAEINKHWFSNDKSGSTTTLHNPHFDAKDGIIFQS